LPSSSKWPKASVSLTILLVLIEPLPTSLIHPLKNEELECAIKAIFLIFIGKTKLKRLGKEASLKN
jgi:hypothetical protein